MRMKWFAAFAFFLVVAGLTHGNVANPAGTLVSSVKTGTAVIGGNTISGITVVGACTVPFNRFPNPGVNYVEIEVSDPSGTNITSLGYTPVNNSFVWLYVGPEVKTWTIFVYYKWNDPNWVYGFPSGDWWVRGQLYCDAVATGPPSAWTHIYVP